MRVFEFDFKSPDKGYYTYVVAENIAQATNVLFQRVPHKAENVTAVRVIGGEEFFVAPSASV